MKTKIIDVCLKKSKWPGEDPKEISFYIILQFWLSDNPVILWNWKTKDKWAENILGSLLQVI